MCVVVNDKFVEHFDGINMIELRNDKLLFKLGNIEAINILCDKINHLEA